MTQEETIDKYKEQIEGYIKALTERYLGEFDYLLPTRYNQERYARARILLQEEISRLMKPLVKIEMLRTGIAFEFLHQHE